MYSVCIFIYILIYMCIFVCIHLCTERTRSNAAEPNDRCGISLQKRCGEPLARAYLASSTTVFWFRKSPSVAQQSLGPRTVFGSHTR